MKLLKRATAAEALGVSARQIDRLIAAGRLRPVRIGRMVRIPNGEIDRFIKRASRVA